MRGLEVGRRARRKRRSPAQQYELAAELRDREAQAARASIEQLEQGWQTSRASDKPVVTDEDIAQVVAMWTGIPVMRIAEEESERLLKMEDALHERVIGQDEAITTVAKAVRRARAGLKDPKRPDRLVHLPRARPASARPSWRGRWPSSCSAPKTP